MLLGRTNKWRQHHRLQLFPSPKGSGDVPVVRSGEGSAKAQDQKKKHLEPFEQSGEVGALAHSRHETVPILSRSAHTGEDTSEESEGGNVEGQKD